MHQTNLKGTLIRSQDSRDQETEPGLLIGERRRRIMDLLGQHGRVTVEALASRFATSVATIRTDLGALAAEGALERTHGGALLRRDDDDRPLAVKRTLHHAEKVRIAKAAVTLIRDGDTLIFDSGTDALVDLEGRLDIRIAEGQHFYAFDYALP